MAAFPEIQKIRYEGPESKNPLAFRHYNESEVVEGKTMKDHLRFSVVYWHTFRGTGAIRSARARCCGPGRTAATRVENASSRVRVAFEFIEKLGAPFYCFHDRDVAPEGATLAETNKNLDAVVKVLKENSSGRASSCCGARPTCSATRGYMHGAATSCNADVVRLRRRAGEEVPGSDQGTRRRELRLLGRPRRLPEPAATPT